MTQATNAMKTKTRVLGAVLAASFAVLAASACGDDDKPQQPSPAAQTQASTAPSSSTTSASCAGAISWEQAGSNVGKRATVRGPVVGANYASTTRGSPTFIDVGKVYPTSGRFTILIWGENRSKFSPAPEKAYTGKTVCVTGLIQSYQGVPEIEAKSPSDIVVQ
jgi:DNA/RNA endonuclease YhcR with UshA esterase domain